MKEAISWRDSRSPASVRPWAMPEIRSGPGRLRARLDERVDMGGEPGMGRDALAPRRLLAGQGRDDLRGHLGQVRIVVGLHAQDRRDDLERQRHRQPGHQVDRTGRREPVEQVVDHGVDERQVARLELPADEDRGDDRPPDVVVVAVHLDHGRADDIGEDPLVRARRVGLVVAKDRRHVVVAGQEPAVVDGVVEQRLVVPEPFPHRERIVEVRLGVEVGGLDRHGITEMGDPGVAWRSEATPGFVNTRRWRQPAPGRPAFITGSSRAPLAFAPNAVGFVRPTRV